MVERAVGLDEHLLACAGNGLKLRHEPLQIAGWQRKQQPIAGPGLGHIPIKAAGLRDCTG